MPFLRSLPPAFLAVILVMLICFCFSSVSAFVLDVSLVYVAVVAAVVVVRILFWLLSFLPSVCQYRRLPLGPCKHVPGGYLTNRPVQPGSSPEVEGGAFVVSCGLVFSCLCRVFFLFFIFGSCLFFFKLITFFSFYSSPDF